MGKREFEFTTGALRTTGYLGVLKSAICVLCVSMAVLGTIVQFHPLGPQGLEVRIIHGTILASAVVVGVWWQVRPWPGHRSAIAFVVWADVSVIAAAALTSAPQARLSATTHMGLIGVFAAFLLGWRVLALHCALATTAIVGFTLWAVFADQATLLDLYIYYAPALSSVVVLPIVIQTVIEAGRRSIKRTARLASRDPLTGLLNRRGMYAAADASKPASFEGPILVVVAAIDVDRFKQLNDGHGHDVGDRALQLVAGQLLGMIRSGDIAARTGGDEFVVIAYRENASDVDSFVDRCATLLLNKTDGAVVTTSIGVVCESSTDRHFSLDSLLRNADSAMYQAKRSGGRLLVSKHHRTSNHHTTL
ncbi:GGDEF domain-containing protein [Rhodococcus sp. 27YEA15]|uniref:GGDEF domain-containing protein n=1 Tax=Rhodococcus sp. 27YEA15 TaxID=3156259 RepID=UPI003C7B65B5